MDSELRYFDRMVFKKLEMEEQARARQLIRGGKLLLVDGRLVVRESSVQPRPEGE